MIVMTIMTRSDCLDKIIIIITIMMQIGPCEGIEMGDDLWMARYLLHRVAEVPHPNKPSFCQ